MNIEALQEMAREMGVKVASDKPSERVLIHEIQKKRGHESCFSSDKRYLCQENCEWRASCKKLRAVWLR